MLQSYIYFIHFAVIHSFSLINVLLTALHTHYQNYMNIMRGMHSMCERERKNVSEKQVAGGGGGGEGSWLEVAGLEVSHRPCWGFTCYTSATAAAQERRWNVYFTLLPPTPLYISSLLLVPSSSPSSLHSLPPPYIPCTCSLFILPQLSTIVTNVWSERSSRHSVTV